MTHLNHTIGFFVEEAERLEAERKAAEGLSFKSCRKVTGVRLIVHHHFCFDEPHAREQPSASKELLQRRNAMRNTKESES